MNDASNFPENEQPEAENTSAQADAENTTAQGRVCPQCGAALEPGASFCTSCGAKNLVRRGAPMRCRYCDQPRGQ